MTEDQRFLAIGIYINGAIYLVGMIWAGLALGAPRAVVLALVSAAVAFFSYMAQVLMPQARLLIHALSAASWLPAALALVALCGRLP